MAIHTAMEKGGITKDSELLRKSGAKIPLACPMSGRRAVVDEDGIKHLNSDSEEEEIGDWRGKGEHNLGVIPEDMEPDIRDSLSKADDNPHSSPRGSIAGSMRSLRSVSQIGSVASGIKANIPAGSRQPSKFTHLQ